MTQFLPANLLALFAPRDPIPYLPPIDKLPHEKRNCGYSAVAPFVKYFEDPKDTPPPTVIESREDRQEKKKKEKAEQAAYKLEQDIAMWNPHTNPDATSDPFKTLFVARISFDTSESKLRREFEVYGRVKKIGIVNDKQTGKPRGYAFIEFEHERDMRSAYKHADGKKIDNRRILVDVERGRTVKGWLPRRLGGGLGGTRRGGSDANVKNSGREESQLDNKYTNRMRERNGPRQRKRSRSRDKRPQRNRIGIGRDRNRFRGGGGGGFKRGRGRGRGRGGMKGGRMPLNMGKKDRRRSRSRERKRHRS